MMMTTAPVILYNTTVTLSITDLNCTIRIPNQTQNYKTTAMVVTTIMKRQTTSKQMMTAHPTTMNMQPQQEVDEQSEHQTDSSKKLKQQ